MQHSLTVVVLVLALGISCSQPGDYGGDDSSVDSSDTSSDDSSSNSDNGSSEAYSVYFFVGMLIFGFWVIQGAIGMCCSAEEEDNTVSPMDGMTTIAPCPEHSSQRILPIGVTVGPFQGVYHPGPRDPSGPTPVPMRIDSLLVSSNGRMMGDGWDGRGEFEISGNTHHDKEFHFVKRYSNNVKRASTVNYKGIIESTPSGAISLKGKWVVKLVDNGGYDQGRFELTCATMEPPQYNNIC